MNKAEIIAAVAQSTGQTQKVVGEEEFEVEISDEEAERYAVGDIMDLVVLKGGK